MSSTIAKGKAGRAGADLSASPPRQKAILVLGVHRSGTSVLTRILNLCGASLPSHLMPPSEINPRGFFESWPIYQLHEEILADLGSSWHDLSPLPASWIQSDLADRYIDRMADLAKQEFGDAPVVVLKDPRICRLVPFWLAVLEKMEVEPAFVLPVRNPLEVAQSLEAAEGVSRQRGLLIWLNGVLQAEHDSRDFTRSFVSYDSLLSDWRKTVDKISTDLKIDFPRVTRRAQAEADSFISEQLRHHQVSPDDLSVREDVLDWIKSTFEWTSLAAAGKKTPTRKLDQLYIAFAGAEKAFGPILASTELARENMETDVQGLREEIRDLGVDRDQLQGQVIPLSEESTELKSQLGKREAQVGELINCIKLMLVWIASRAPGSNTSGEELQILLQAMDSSEGESIAESAMEGLRRYQDSVESALVDGDGPPRRQGLRHSAVQTAFPDRIQQPPSEDLAGRALQEEDLEGLRSENTALKEEARSQREETQVLNEQITQKQAMLAQALAELANVEGGIATRDAEYRILQETFRQQEQKLESSGADLEVADARAAVEYERRSALETHLQQLKDETDESSRLAADLGAKKHELQQQFDAQVRATTEEKKDLRARIEQLDAQLRTASGLEEELRDQREKWTEADERAGLDRAELQKLRTRVEHLTDDRVRIRRRLSEREKILQEMQTSRSWRMTLPIRRFGILLRKIGIRKLLRPLGRLPGLRK